MAWTSLNFAYGSVLTSTKMTQLYDNITAVTNGDTGAPQIKGASFQYQTGTNLIARSDVSLNQATSITQFFVDTGSRATPVQFTAPVDCTITTRIHLRSTAVADNAYGRIYVNGVATGTLRNTTSNSFVTYDEDITVNAGDTIELWGYMGPGDLGTAAYLSLLSNNYIGWVFGGE